MKIIDYEIRGSCVRFYLGKDDDTDYHGDDWNDRPYDCNAGTVFQEYITGYADIVFHWTRWCWNPAMVLHTAASLKTI